MNSKTKAKLHEAVMTKKLSEEALSKRIKGAAYNVARNYNVDPEDVEQEIILAILEEYTKDPSFLQQTDAFIVNKGAWAARDTLKRMAKQQWNHEAEVDDAEGTPLLHLIGEYDPWEAENLKAAINEAYYFDLTPIDQEIVAALYEGLNRREIGQRVGLSHTTVNNHIPVIAEAIRAHL